MMITISERAQAELSVIVVSAVDPVSVKGVRLFTLPISEDSYQVGMAIVRKSEDSDLAIDAGDTTLYLAESELEYLEGAELDYDDKTAAGGFRLDFPRKAVDCTTCAHIGTCGSGCG